MREEWRLKHEAELEAGRVYAARQAEYAAREAESKAKDIASQAESMAKDIGTTKEALLRKEIELLKMQLKRQEGGEKAPSPQSGAEWRCTLCGATSISKNGLASHWSIKHRGLAKSGLNSTVADKTAEKGMTTVRGMGKSKIRRCLRRVQPPLIKLLYFTSP